MKLLVHVCCAPCFCFTDKRLREQGHEVTGFWYNPNIHPAAEYNLRLDALRKYSALKGAPVVFRGGNLPEDIERWARAAFAGETRAVPQSIHVPFGTGFGASEGSTRTFRLPTSDGPRCAGCYKMRLREAALYAKENKFDAFTTTLLYSIYQKHDLARAVGERIAAEIGIPFYYEDFRTGWREGIVISKDLGLYRQKYCGCFVSEREIG